MKIMELLSIAAFAFALSLDGFGAGISYGMRKIKIPASSLIVISLTSSTAIGISMLFGHVVAQYISLRIAKAAGALILILMGFWILLQTWSENKKQLVVSNGSIEKNPSAECRPIINFKIKALGVVVQILREPTVADFDKSGYISTKESLLLGLALAMDALGAGFGAAMTGFKPLLTPLVVGLAKFVLVSLGVYTGRRYTAKWLGERAAVLPGWVLICLGVARVIKI